ncbi:MAG: DUF2804 domain-containing protein [Acidimicrobiales bacterium]|nr:DUF2804 domain-containing protein [Acidimicrobiales bacterium]
MTTHEHEITEAVPLCEPDGLELADSALGWSRQPLHRINLKGRWARTKRWDYWSILAGDLAIAVTYSNIGYLGVVDVWWVDLATGQTGGRSTGSPGSIGIRLPEQFGSRPLRWSSKGLRLEMATSATETTIRAEWTQWGGKWSRLEATIKSPPGHESLNVVIPWSKRAYQFTSKHQALPAHGFLEVDGYRREFGGDHGDAWGVLDVGRGRWPYENTWNWAGGAGRSLEGATIGLQFGGKWTVGSGFTENGLIVDGRLSKIGNELDWDYNWDDPMKPWRVTSPDGSVDVVLEPRYDKYAKAWLGFGGIAVHQVFGQWSGTVTDDAGDTWTLDSIQGFAEETRTRW